MNLEKIEKTISEAFEKKDKIDGSDKALNNLVHETINLLDNGKIRIQDTFNVDKDFTTIGFADIVPGLQKTADRLVDISYKSRNIKGRTDKGGITIDVLIDSGFVPSLIIEENSDGGNTEREKFEFRLGSNPLSPTMKSQVEKHNIRFVQVPIHNDEHCMEHIENVDPDLIVFGGTRIIRG